MKVKTLRLNNFRGFADLTLEFSDGLTVLVGENGAGKSSVLDALAIMLSWAVARIRTENGSSRRLAGTDFHMGENDASISAGIYYGDTSYDWTLAGVTPGIKTNLRSDWTGLTRFADVIRGQIAPSSLLIAYFVPIMVYYPSARAVTSVPVGVRGRESIGHLEAYDSALSGSANFQTFFEWFRAQEDLQNETRAHIEDTARAEEREKTIAEILMCRDESLRVVKHALQKFLPEFEDFEIRRRELSMVAKKRGRGIRIDQLSDGEKCLIAMVGDIARRLAIANPTLKDRLHGVGVVLIDEIELHLHPAWQRSIIGNLRRVFPNIQFIVSTHSPQVLGEVAHDDIRCLYQDSEKGQQAYIPSRSLGLDSNAILEEVFGAPSRNLNTASKLQAVFELIDQDEFEKARDGIDALEGELGGQIPELIEAKTMILMLEGSGAEH